MSRVAKRFSKAIGQSSSLPLWISPQLTQLSETAPSGPHWLHEVKLDGFRMAARIDGDRRQLLTRTGLDWSDKYPSIVAALATARAKRAYLDGELCGIIFRCDLRDAVASDRFDEKFKLTHYPRSSAAAAQGRSPHWHRWLGI
jgi:ATP-dependent DNA ligase